MRPMFATSRVCLQTVFLSARSVSVSYQTRRSLRSVSRPEQLRLPASAAAAAPALRIPRIISAPSILGRSAAKVGSERRSTYRPSGEPVGWLPVRPGRPVTVAPAGAINHGWLSASSCDAAALLPLRRCLFINRSPSVSPILDLHCLWLALPCRR